MNWTKKETTVIEKLCSNTQNLAHAIGPSLSTAFNNSNENQYAQDILISLQVLRQELGLKPDKKPGDIDILIVPILNNTPLLHKTIAIEAKISRPTINNPSKNVPKMGITQAKGLLDDGFPYVGLLHIVIPEKSPIERHKSAVVMRIGENKKLEDTGLIRTYDPFPLECADRQEGRIKSSQLPKEISYQVLALILDGDHIVGNTCAHQYEGKINENISGSLLENIHNLILTKPEKFKRIKWYCNK